MAIYAIYSFEFHEGEKSLLYKDTNVKAIDMANEILGNIIRDGLVIIGKKKGQNLTLNSLNLIERNGVFSWVLCNVKDLPKYEGHTKTVLESHPGSYIILDNRPNVCQIAIEKNSAFYAQTDKVVQYIQHSINERLTDYGITTVIKHKYQAGKFKEIVMERIYKYNDSVKKIVWDFPNPEKVKGIDSTRQMKDRLEGLKLLVQATNALKGQLTLNGSKGDPIKIDDDKIDDLAQIIALSAQNSYNLSYYFYNSSVVKFKDVAYAFFEIGDNVIHDFETGQSINDGNGVTYELIEKLDEIRINIADYGYEEVIN